jgi:HSP20 family molecular chaperone IbpA
MRNDPYDDIFRNLAKMMEELLKDLPAQGMSHFVGYTIITQPGEAPRVLRRDREGNRQDVPYEVIETKDRIYVTAELEGDDDDMDLYADIGPDSICIHQNDGETIIDLDCDIDVERSYYDVLHGVMDIVCYKKAC